MKTLERKRSKRVEEEKKYGMFLSLNHALHSVSLAGKLKYGTMKIRNHQRKKRALKIPKKVLTRKRRRKTARARTFMRMKRMMMKTRFVFHALRFTFTGRGSFGEGRP